MLKTMKTKTTIQNNKRLVARKKRYFFSGLLEMLSLWTEISWTCSSFLNSVNSLQIKCGEKIDTHTGLDNLTMTFDFPDLKNWVITEKKKMLGGIQLCRLHLGRRGTIKTRRYPNRREGGLYQCKHSHITFFLLST